jgi:hypothetical protein
MDSLMTAAARALAAGDPFGALNRVALRNDAPALALRGIAMAQLGDFPRARTLIRRAARRFGAREVVARARCALAEAEIALASRDLTGSARALSAAAATLESHGDSLNAAHARYLQIRRWLLIGRLDDAESLLARLDPDAVPPALRAAHQLFVAGIAIRRLRTTDAAAALERAHLAARASGIASLAAEVDGARRLLDAPAARLISRGHEESLRLRDVETLLGSNVLVIDACWHVVHGEGRRIGLLRRPVLFTLVRVLAEAWPSTASRAALIQRAFRMRQPDESHRARLRVEIGRLRRVLRPLADITPTEAGFVLAPRRQREVVVLALPVEQAHADVLALLSDGESWSSSALALALDESQRNVQRALDSLALEGKARPVGRGRARRWVAPPLPGFTTPLLLPGLVPGV